MSALQFQNCRVETLPQPARGGGALPAPAAPNSRVCSCNCGFVPRREGRALPGTLCLPVVFSLLTRATCPAAPATRGGAFHSHSAPKRNTGPAVRRVAKADVPICGAKRNGSVLLPRLELAGVSAPAIFGGGAGVTHRGIHTDGRPTFTVEPGPVPMLQWLALDRLVIDEAYQRPLGRGNWKSIENIAANFQWSRFSPVLVAPIPGGLFAVIDGQHRTHAAALCGIAEIPAMVVQVGLEEQSRAFAWVNSQTVRVTLFHIYKAALAAGEDWAVRADAAVTAGGCRLMPYNKSASEKGAGEVFCIGLLKKLIEAGHDTAISAGLAAIRAVPALDRSVCYTDFILQPWIGAVALSGCRNHHALVTALQAQNPFKVIERAQASLDRSVPMAVRSREALRRLIAESEMRASA